MQGHLLSLGSHQVVHYVTIEVERARQRLALSIRGVDGLGLPRDSNYKNIIFFVILENGENNDKINGTIAQLNRNV